MSKLAQVAYEQIRQRIASGEWNTGTPLSEPTLAKVLQVSPDWLYRNSRKLPFTRRLGPEALGFFYRGIQTWIRSDVGV